MKKLILLFVLLGILPAFIKSCKPQTYYFTFDSIMITPYKFQYQLNDSTLLYDKTHSLLDYSDTNSIDSVYWLIENKFNRVANVNSNFLLTNTYAFPYEPTLVFLYRLEQIYFVAEVDYNDAIAAGDTLNDIILLSLYYKDSLMSVESYCQSLKAQKNNQFESSHKYKMYLKEKPTDTIPFVFKIIYQYENEIYHHQTSQEVPIY